MGRPSKEMANVNEGKSSKKAANVQGAVMRFLKLTTCQSHKSWIFFLKYGSKYG